MQVYLLRGVRSLVVNKSQIEYTIFINGFLSLNCQVITQGKNKRYAITEFST